jgi:hypothetical protein
LATFKAVEPQSMNWKFAEAGPGKAKHATTAADKIPLILKPARRAGDETELRKLRATVRPQNRLLNIPITPISSVALPAASC